MFGNIDRKCRLTHRRATGDDNQVTAMQSARLFVKVDKPGRQSGYLSATVKPFVDVCNHISQD